MCALSHEEARDLVDLRVDSEVCEPIGYQRFQTLIDKLALGTATVGVYGLDPVGLVLLAAAGAGGTRVIAVDPDSAVPTDSLPDTVRRALASLSEGRLGWAPTALLTADVVVVSVCGVQDPVAAAGGLRAGQLVLLASEEPACEAADLALEPLLDRAGLAAGVDVAVAWISVAPECVVIGTDELATELAQRFLLSLPELAPMPTVVTLLEGDTRSTAAEPSGTAERERVGEQHARESAARSSVDQIALGSVRMSVLLPCHNEATTIGNVVRAFRVALPTADVYVYDNASTDGTGEVARAAGAIVRRSPALGKGNVVRRMFAEIDADVYVLADGDDTYEVGAAPELVRQLRTQCLDMVVGRRVEVAESTRVYPPGHRFGNRLLTGIVQRLFGATCEDMLSGYRVFSRRYVKSFPAFSRGFETETEMTVHALDLSLPFAEIATEYRERPSESTSKLRTIPDGIRIARFILRLWKEYEPLRFFGTLALLSGLLAAFTALFGAPFLTQTLAGQTAIAWSGLGIVLATAGVILDTVSRSRREMKRIMYLAQPYGLARPRPSNGHLPLDEGGSTPRSVDATA